MILEEALGWPWHVAWGTVASRSLQISGAGSGQVGTQETWIVSLSRAQPRPHPWELNGPPPTASPGLGWLCVALPWAQRSRLKVSQGPDLGGLRWEPTQGEHVQME